MSQNWQVSSAFPCSRSRASSSSRPRLMRARVTRALVSLGREELRALIDEQGEAELTCQFCDRVYHYDRGELEALLASI